MDYQGDDVTAIFLGDIVSSIISFPRVLPSILGAFVPYALVLAGFGAFIVWNGGIVLGMQQSHWCSFFCSHGIYCVKGDKSNHIPAFHIPQLYYFVGFATILGWPALISGKGGPKALAREVQRRMFGSAR